ncbi:Multiple RNA-binding domain-containing protein 1 [Purpureocillium takamizusanense]|uniref:Multiple RNA-binding domain-containing protein 1 n=1 Tax=Purpureocillium takamizusanense TaxID=2060973 RepID=A0A9Q8QPQ7_9HYPO|nr:Multiple RNA-binding domain-containing protein 1 [Purpureocillium takamizusanense]UNI23520.1 Multiple RNA-binding domain-containing protein 1 [Purpureocillium takamizusanense]
MATSRIFIKGLPPNITETDFRKHFSTGNREVTDVKLIPQRRIGYVGYKTADDASRAVKYFNRSYIRMSKISVEPAKAISDPALAKNHHNGPRAADASTSRAAARVTSDQDASSKKRKRDEPAKADPKLREFLQVMKSGREGVIADDTTFDAAEGYPEAGSTVVPEGESDDEYEQIPTRKEKSRRIDSPTRAVHVAHSPPPREDKAPDPAQADDAQETTGAAEQVRGDGVVPATEATDDDWLRLRTNRLLDLVDPGDLPAQQVPGPDEKPPQQQDTENSSDEVTHDEVEGVTMGEEMATGDAAVEAISKTSRLFVRNLPFSVTEEDIRDAFERFGSLQEVHVPTNAAGTGKGFALVLFTDPGDAVEAFQAMDGATFQGRIIHIIPASRKKELGLDEFGISKLPLRKQNLIRKKAEAASTTFNWNSLYMNQDAVNTSIASRLGVSKSEMLDPTSADAAIKQAIAETTVIQETKAYFAANGVDLDAFKSQKRGDTSILVKNFSYGTTLDELRRMFEESGPVLKVLMPPSGTIAIVQFAQANHAKAAFGKLAYRRIKDSVLFLEKGPKDLFKGDQSDRPVTLVAGQKATGVQKLSVNDLLSGGDRADEAETTSLFIRNLNFATSTNKLAEAFQSLDGFVSARVKTKMDPKKPGQTLSMGFGFAEFRSKAQAAAALKVMDGYVLDGHTLGVKASHKGHDAAEERRREDRAKKAAAQRTKIVIKNLPFQATKKDIRTLFGTYGQLRSVRVPKKADHTTRGFAFADFVTPREAENALIALRDTHLLGRRLVLDYAEAEAVDAEEEIEKMQRKVGGQANKVALQRLTGGGRKKVNIGNDGDEDVEA